MEGKSNRYQGWTHDGYEVIDGDGNVAARCTNWNTEDEDAEYITRAVNCHDKLVLFAREHLVYMKQKCRPQSAIDELKDLIAEAEGGGNE